MKYLIEYNEDHSQFHYNWLENSGEWHNPLFAYGWRPICFISDLYVSDKSQYGFGKKLDELSGKDYTYEFVCSEMLKFFSKHE